MKRLKLKYINLTNPLICAIAPRHSLLALKARGFSLASRTQKKRRKIKNGGEEKSVRPERPNSE
ncbi:hypothetical protein Scep_008093 [Stephania cephalantha]|uniref:Uncharacterized protein n=1 Tax=Stephania cephalantha TaxID=152367 RepID=A0AAP0PQM7_9MAGN